MRGIAGRGSGHLVEDGEAARDLAGRGPVGLDDAGEVLPETGVQEKIIIADLEACFRKKVGKVLL